MKRTILLVDDEENITSSLARLLRRDGYNILRANSGQEGLTLLMQNQVGVIISDQRMPGMTGTEFLSKVRDLYPDSVRIVLSGFTELKSVTDAINCGAVYKFITKPWEDDLLRANVEEAFQRYEMKLENVRLALEVQQANDNLSSINRELEQRVERKTREIVHNLEILRISQEMLEVMPMAVIGIGNDGLIVIANQMAHLTFSRFGMQTSLLGDMADTILPRDLMDWVSSGLHQIHEKPKIFSVTGHDVRCWCRSLGEFSRSRGILLVMDAESKFDAIEECSSASSGER